MPSKGGIDVLTNACRDVLQRELKKQFAATYNIENQKSTPQLSIPMEMDQDGEPPVVPQSNYQKIFQPSESSSVYNNQWEDCEERQLPFWQDLNRRQLQMANNSLGPRNIWEEQVEWTEKGMMWPYPINNDYMIGEEEQTSFVDHVFLEAEEDTSKCPQSKAVSHFLELVQVGLAKNPYMSVEKKRQHLKWFVDYFNKASTGKYKELLMK